MITEIEKILAESIHLLLVVMMSLKPLGLSI